jgi:uncharacterized membrane protein
MTLSIAVIAAATAKAKKGSTACLCLRMRKQVVNLKARRSHVHWDLVVKTAVLVCIATFILGVMVSFPLLAFLN